MIGRPRVTLDAADRGNAFRRGATLLDGRYTLRELLEAEQPVCGAPAVWLADGPGATYIAKIWSRRSGDDPGVRSVWNHELRSLLKLSGLQRSSEYFAGLEALGKDDHGYYVLVDTGGRQLLSETLEHRDRYNWLRSISVAATRAQLWKGMHRLATALALLHDQGILHRALISGSVFTDLAGECDFRLSGFEWSLRLSTAGRGGSLESGPRRMRAPELGTESATYSIASDWFDFGLLAAEVVSGITVAGDGIYALAQLRRDLGDARFLSGEERSLLGGLLLPNPDARRLECVDVARRVGALVLRLSTAQSTGRSLFLGVHLASDGSLGEAIFRVTEGRVRSGDNAGQLAFIQEDLNHDPTLTARAGLNPHYAVEGRELVYRVTKFQPRLGVPNWRAGFCIGLDRGARERGQPVSLDGRKIMVGAITLVEQWLKDPSQRSVNWDQALPFEPSWEIAGSDAFDFLRFTNTLDALLSAARIWPVEIVSTGQDEQTSAPIVTLSAGQDDQRDRVARALGLEVPARQMERAFVEEIGEVDGETDFVIADEPQLARHDRREGRWRIREAILDGGSRRYVFLHSGGDATIPTGLAYLRPADLAGSYSLLERRLKAIDALREQATMLRAFETPGEVSRDTLEEFEEDNAIKALDAPKRKALKAIWRTQPMFALQGPPGTGKTALVEAMIRRALEEDSSLQFVATAQANGTVDFLGNKLSKPVDRGGLRDAIIVRLDQDEEKGLSPLAPGQIAAELAARLESSDLGRNAPAHIARRLRALSDGTGQEGRRERRDMGRLIARSANVVLSTTTSGELSDIVHGGKRFDWCIVEEAGKAHGFDLALPMLASHRMLMIGDHEQLPAFNEMAYIDLLGNPQKARSAVAEGGRFIPRSLGYDLGPAESEEAMQVFEAKCARWLPMIRAFGHVFQEGSALPTSSAPMAARLNEQHRMHPEICDLVSACFYPDLQTSDMARQRLLGPDPFELVEGSWLPSERIVFIDMPWIQSTRSARGQDQGPKGRMMLSSAAEAEVVVDVISQIKPLGTCDLQVLAPYNRQVPVIQRSLSRALTAGKLPLLERFRKPKGKERFGSTIDGFQGEEADVIIVSLVRNNHRPPPGGVGHLSERARLNVMLSRASRKLVLIGSWEFFTRRAGDETWKDPAHPLRHLAKVFHELQEAMRNGTAKKISLADIPQR
jgi:hypothetical protein